MYMYICMYIHVHTYSTCTMYMYMLNNCSNREHYLIRYWPHRYKHCLFFLPCSLPQPNAVNNHGCTALHVACNNGQDVVVDVLLQSDVGISSQNNKGQTALHYAAFSHHGALCMELLVKAGAPTNVQDNAGRTPLHVTAIHGFYLRTESLITHGLYMYMFV